jgi:hypothetical protein
MTMESIGEDSARESARPPTLYQFRCLDLPPADAELVVSAWGAELAERFPARGGGFALELPGGRLALHPAPLTGRSRGSRVRFVGRLRSRWGTIVIPVELVVEPWSTRRSELGLRPLGSVCLRSPACARLFDRLAQAALDTLRSVVSMPIPPLAEARVAAEAAPPVPAASPVPAAAAPVPPAAAAAAAGPEDPDATPALAG